MMADILTVDKLLYFFMNHHLLTLFKIKSSSSFQNWHGTRSSYLQCCWLVWELEKKEYSFFIHSFHWHVQNAMIPCCSQEILPILSVTYPSTLFHQLVFPPPSLHLAIYFLVCLVALLLPYIIFFWNSVFFHSLYMPKPV